MAGRFLSAGAIAAVVIGLAAAMAAPQLLHRQAGEAKGPLPAPPAGRQLYRKVRDRSSYAFALFSVAAIVAVEDGVISAASLAFGGLVDDFLKTVKEFMDKNPREVVTLLLTNPDNAPMSTFDGIYKRVDQEFGYPNSTKKTPVTYNRPTHAWLLGSGPPYQLYECYLHPKAHFVRLAAALSVDCLSTQLI